MSGVNVKIMAKFSSGKFIWFIAVIGLLIFLHLTKILLPVESLIARIFNPILSGFYSISSSLRTTYNEQTSKGDLLAQIKDLENQLNQLTVENVKLKTLEEENQILREHLQFLTKQESEFVIANIISRGSIDNPVTQSNIIIINKGTEDRITQGLPVISSQGIIVGKVMEVKDYLAEVYLTTNSICKLAATIQNQDKTSGIVQGELGLTVRMEFIPQSEEIKIGDIIVTSGLEYNIPRGLVIGKVSQVIKDSNELWQSAVVEPMVDLDELIIVSVLLP